MPRPCIWASRLPDGMGEAAAQWVDRLFAGGSVVADSVSQGVFGCVTRVLGWMPQLLLFGLTALLSAYFLAGDAPRLRALAARHVPEEWRARGGQLLVRLRAALRGYVLAQGKLLLVTFGVVSLGLLAALRRPHAVLLGALIAVVDALPVLGSGTVLLPWAAVSLLRGSGGLALGLTVTYAAAAFARSALEPRLLGAADRPAAAADAPVALCWLSPVRSCGDDPPASRRAACKAGVGAGGGEWRGHRWSVVGGRHAASGKWKMESGKFRKAADSYRPP